MKIDLVCPIEHCTQTNSLKDPKGGSCRGSMINRLQITPSRCTKKRSAYYTPEYIMPSGSNMNRLKCQRQKKSFVSIGMIGTFRYLGLDPSICLAKDFRISMKIYENCILNDILQGMRHARQLVTAGVRMLPCFPGVGDGADYGDVWASNQWNCVWDYRFLKKMIPHLLLVPQLKITLSWQRNLSITLLLQFLLKLLWTLC